MKKSPIQKKFLSYSFKMSLAGKIITGIEIFLIHTVIYGSFVLLALIGAGVRSINDITPEGIVYIVIFTCIIPLFMSLATIFDTSDRIHLCSWFLYKYFPISKDSRKKALEKLIHYGYDEKEVKQGLDIF